MRVLAIASSIGGTGKTTTSIALASAFQRFGDRTALMDFDIGLGNVERLIGSVCLGPDLLDVIHSAEAFATELAPETYQDGLLVIPSSRMPSTQTLTPQQIQRLFERCEALGFDYIICDLPPGLGELVLSMADLADDVIITAPADTSLVYTVSPLLHRLKARRARSSRACRHHILITRSLSQPSTPKEWPVVGHLPDQDCSLLGAIPGVESDPLEKEDVLIAYANITSGLRYPDDAFNDKGS